jgi:hypothetical protein
MFTILVPLIALVLWIAMWVFGLHPEQRARAEAKRAARAVARLARQQRIEAERQRREWHEIVKKQRARGDAGFANEADATEALSGRGGRRSNLDERWF